VKVQSTAANRKKALVVGALGVIGRALTDHLSKLPDWEVVGLSRRRPDFESGAEFVSVDLLDSEDCEKKLGPLNGVTHVFYAAYQERPTPAELVEPNVRMLRNVVETVEAASQGLRHVGLMQGGKAYGVHLGPFKTPAKETDPRHMPPNFYYDQEDYLKEHERGKDWSWSAFRPEAVCGFAVGNPMNLLMVIAVYAAISKELGLPLRFPGKLGAYAALYQVTDASLLARAAVWAATEPRCAGEVFNVTNGDYFRWEHLWPSFADFFGMELAPPQPLSLVEHMSDKGPVWDTLVEKHGLKPYRYGEIAAWGFGDAIFGSDWDNISSTVKARRLGFGDCLDTEDMFLRRFSDLRKERVIP
jgi:nucleoside-diphosphate-sugar epimerase